MDEYRKRLHYKATHRGMKETDKLVGGFAVEKLESLSDEQLESFDVLLEESDNDLLRWISGQEKPPRHIDPQLIKQIKAFSKG